MRYLYLLLIVFILAGCHNSKESVNIRQATKDTVNVNTADIDTVRVDSRDIQPYTWVWDPYPTPSPISTKDEIERENRINDSIYKETFVIVQTGDSLFHLTPNCRLVKLKRAKFTDVYSAIKKKKTLCRDCLDGLIPLAELFSHGEYMWEWMDNNIEELFNYIDSNYEDFSEYFHSDDEE